MIYDKSTVPVSGSIRLLSDYNIKNESIRIVPA